MTTSRTTRLSRAVTHGAVALALGVGLASFPSQAGAAPAAPRLADAAAADASPRLPADNVALTWAPLYMSNDHVYTREEALALARRFDLVSGMPYGLRDHSAAMKAANPDLTLLAYSNATLASANTAAGLPEAAFAHGPAGERIKAVDWDTWLMQPDHPAWRAAADQLCRHRSQLGGFDGCLVDMLTLGIYARGYMTGTPADPATGRLYTQREYRDLMVDLAADLRARSPHLVQVGNMVENGYRYWRAEAASRPLVASSPSAQMEDFLRGAGDRPDAWPSVEEWQEDVARRHRHGVGRQGRVVHHQGVVGRVRGGGRAVAGLLDGHLLDGRRRAQLLRLHPLARPRGRLADQRGVRDARRPRPSDRRHAPPRHRCLGARLRRRPGAGEPDRLPGLGDRGPGGHPARRLRGAGGREPRAGCPLRRGPAVRRRGAAG